MTISSTAHQPKFAVFLDIDGVFNRNGVSTVLIDEIVKEKFGELDHCSKCATRCITCETAAAHLFDSTSISHFHHLVTKIQEIAEAHIIISSDWRRERSMSQLKQIFHIHPFTPFILDKTTEQRDGEWRVFCRAPHVGRCRASEIKEWLAQHPGYFGHLIFDDIDDHLTQNFSEKFISTFHEGAYLLRGEDTTKAYQIFLKMAQEAGLAGSSEVPDQRAPKGPSC